MTCAVMADLARHQAWLDDEDQFDMAVEHRKQIWMDGSVEDLMNTLPEKLRARFQLLLDEAAQDWVASIEDFVEGDRDE
jgi:hypothetical protein